MSTSCSSSSTNVGFCETCRAVVPVCHVEREGFLFLHRDCPKCGPSDKLISRDAAAYYEKREFVGHTEDPAAGSCHLDCINCRHGVAPALVVIDVTNHCNMNCPICLANIPAMGFEFHPPLEYFDRIFQYLSKLKPVPKVQLFGGEPTCRYDLQEILKMAKGYGLTTWVVTNGLRLADENYCREILETRPQLLLGLDGVNPEIQRKLRKNPGSLDKKKQAIENIAKLTKSKISILCTTAAGISEQLLPDLLQYVFEKRRTIGRVMLIPMQANSGPERVGEESTTIECVEHLMEKCYPGMQFVPVGAVQKLQHIVEVLGGADSLTGTHPNCECISFMIGDDMSGGFRPISDYLKTSFKTFIKDMMTFDEVVAARVKHGFLGKIFGERGRKLHLTLSLLMWSRAYIKWGEFAGPNPWRRVSRVLWKVLVFGKSIKRSIRTVYGGRSLLHVVILPYEEPGCLESSRLVQCPVAFACEHPQKGNVILVPFCSYFVSKDAMLRKSTERWGTVKANAESANGNQEETDTQVNLVS